MANKDIVKGFEPFGKLLHSAVYVNGATAVYPGDLVSMDNAGLIAKAAAGTSPLLGVALNYAAASGDVLVADHPSQEFLGQCDDATVDAQTDIGLNYNITVGTASTLYKRSAMAIDASTQATDSNLPLRLLRVGPAIDNALGDKVDMIVKINNHQLGNAVVGL